MRPAQYRYTEGKAIGMAFIMSCLLAIPVLGALVGLFVVLSLMIRIAVDSTNKLAHAGILMCFIVVYLAVIFIGIANKAEMFTLAMAQFFVSFVGLVILARGGVEWYKGNY